MKKYLYALIATCIGTILIGLNTKEHNPPLPEQPTQAVVEAPVAPLPVEPVPEPIPVVEAIVEAPAPVYAPMSEIDAKNFIYEHESGFRLDARNSIGCIGLGQDCNGALVLDCPDWTTNFACQDAFWERYMGARYGTWERARQHWLARVPINGRDVGNWW